MRNAAWLIAIVALSACSPPPIDRAPVRAYASGPDRLRAALGSFNPFGRPCQQSSSGGRIVRTPRDECYRFGAPRMWHGTIRTWGYGNRFTVADDAGADRTEYLVANAVARKGCAGSLCQPLRLEEEQSFEVRFIGRQTLVPGRYGHSGMFEHLIVVDRLVSEEATPAGQ